MDIYLDSSSLDDYRLFLKIKSLPSWSIRGRVATVPDEYSSMISREVVTRNDAIYQPSPFLFDYQRDIAEMAVNKRKFALFVAPGLGKTLMYFEYAKAILPTLGNRCGLMISPAMVIDQTIGECRKFYGDALPIERVEAKDLQKWLHESGPGRFGITSFNALKDSVSAGNLGMMIIDESSMLKSHYGKWGMKIIELGQGVANKLCGTGTPAPNDRIEYANHAVLLDSYPTVNSFLAKFFVNRGQTNERWEMRPHALEPFYRALSHWCIFLNDPSTYGWKDNVTSNMPPIIVHIHDVELTKEQESLAYTKHGVLFGTTLGGIGTRSVYGQLAKGNYRGKKVDTRKPAYIKNLVDSWPEESTIIWCIYNEEQKRMAELFPDAANIDGQTPLEKRRELIADFQAGRRKQLISKAEILGFGLNLQIATRHVFSGLQDSYEDYHQCVKRSNRVGSTKPLNVHIPLTDIERPMVENVMRKCRMIDDDTREQERIFRRQRWNCTSNG